MAALPDRIPAFQLNAAGLLVDVVPAMESIAQPGEGVYHVPAGATVEHLPEGWITTERTDSGFFDWKGHWPDDKWPRFNGHAWELVTRPVAPAQAAPTPVEKLAAFLAENPDVSALINANTTPSA